MAWLAAPQVSLAQAVEKADSPTPKFDAPSPAANSFSYEVHDRDWLDEARQRAIPVRVYMPAGKPVGVKACPLVVFSHGIGGSRRGYSYLGNYFASQGYIALHVQHIGSDSELWFGNPFKLVERLQFAARDVEAIERARDIGFALDKFLASEWGSVVDTDRIIAAGHSYGANTTMLLAGARVVRNGVSLNLRDARIKAAVMISAPPFYGEASAADVLDEVAIPTLHVTATEDVIAIPGYISPAQDRIKVFDAMGGPSKVLVVFKGGSHSVFTDRSMTGGTSLNPKVKQATQELLVKFVSAVFKQDPQGLEKWRVQYAGLLAQWVVKQRALPDLR